MTNTKSTHATVVIKQGDNRAYFFRNFRGEPQFISLSLNKFMSKLYCEQVPSTIEGASFWLVFIGNEEYLFCGINTNYNKPFQKTKSILGNSGYIYEIDLDLKKLTGWKQIDGVRGEQVIIPYNYLDTTYNEIETAKDGRYNAMALFTLSFVLDNVSKELKQSIEHCNYLKRKEDLLKREVEALKEVSDVMDNYTTDYDDIDF